MRVGRNQNHTAPQWSQQLRRVQACINKTERTVINDLFKIRKLTFDLGKIIYEAQKNHVISSPGESTLKITIPNRSRSESKNRSENSDRPDRRQPDHSKKYKRFDKKASRNGSKSKRRSEPLETTENTLTPCPDLELERSPVTSDSESSTDLNVQNDEIDLGTESDMAE